MQNEFDLIARYFDWSIQPDRHQVVAVGDDAAVLDMPIGKQLVVTVDTLIESVHFPSETDPYSIAVKALAVNLSDLAAMAAEPAWFTLALSLPENNPEFLEEFSRGLQETAARYGISLVGGDTTRGPLTISIQAMGWVPEGAAILRSGARAGDDIYVTGELGAAALGLLGLDSDRGYPADDACLMRLNRPEPRLEVGLALRSVATAMIDCSDGFVADLAHLAAASQLAASVARERLPLSAAVENAIREDQSLWKLPLTGGDDYELIFTAAGNSRSAIEQIATESSCRITHVGKMRAGSGVAIYDEDNQPVDVGVSGYSHF
ncbi:MAG: thiamine-phosphate kinase [Thiotrichales bacterium]